MYLTLNNSFSCNIILYTHENTMLKLSQAEIIYINITIRMNRGSLTDVILLSDLPRPILYYIYLEKVGRCERERDR